MTWKAHSFYPSEQKFLVVVVRFLWDFETSTSSKFGLQEFFNDFGFSHPWKFSYILCFPVFILGWIYMSGKNSFSCRKPKLCLIKGSVPFLKKLQWCDSPVTEVAVFKFHMSFS